MSEIRSFSSNRKFFAADFFPYGLARSGEFTRSQVDLLEAHGYAYQSLEDGSRSAESAEEERFVSVCRGEVEPESCHEKVWRRFCQKTRSTKALISPALFLSSSLGDEEYIDEVG
jgi:uncharacterized protein YifE (UPF0438 family)